MVTFAPDEIGLADKSPCAGIRADLKMCLLASDCCKKGSGWKKKYRVSSRSHLEVHHPICRRGEVYINPNDGGISEKKTPRECLKDTSVPDECIQLRQSFFECKRSLLDTRRRFRGHKGY